MRIAYIECFAGISGDMLLGALVQAGVSPALLQRTVEDLNLGATLRLSTVDRSGVRATKVDVLVNGAITDQVQTAAETGGENGHFHPVHEHDEVTSDHHHHDHKHADENHSHSVSSAVSHSHSHTHEHSHGDQAEASASSHAHSHEHSHTHGRSLSQIRTLIANSGIAADARHLATRTFELLGESEAKIHNVPVEQVHFHEVGAVDAIIDIVCASVGLCSLGVDQWVCSPLNVGGGFVECAHGKFPVPAPATADLLRGAPTYSSGIQMELVTPTGAALLRALGCSYGPSPLMRVNTIGYGAGTRNPKRFANVVRIQLGESDVATNFPTETVTVLECAIDDQSPQVLAHAMQLALERGALDVMTQAVQMKKNRLGTLLTVLCRPSQKDEMQVLLFRETSTIGIRVRQEERVYLKRESVEVATEYGVVRVKIGSAHGEQLNAMPEYEDCRAIAAAHGVPLKQVMQTVLAALAETKVQA